MWMDGERSGYLPQVFIALVRMRGWRGLRICLTAYVHPAYPSSTEVHPSLRCEEEDTSSNDNVFMNFACIEVRGKADVTHKVGSRGPGAAGYKSA